MCYEYVIYKRCYIYKRHGIYCIYICVYTWYIYIGYMYMYDICIWHGYDIVHIDIADIHGIYDIYIYIYIFDLFDIVNLIWQKIFPYNSSQQKKVFVW